MAQMLKEGDVLHYPTLKTVLQIEQILEKANDGLTKAGIKRGLGKEIMHQTLSLILDYLQISGKVIKDGNVFVWIYNPSIKLERAIKKGIRVR